jgi:nucleoside-diphosphate-sugar epimerase
MFGWFDRKHLGWLSRFMKKVPVFPIPGHGRYMRQPLYVGDFCNIIISCIENRIPDGIYNISGHEKVDYIDIIREIKRATGAKTLITKIPYRLFHILLWIWGLFDKNPPFTTQQLAALSAKDEFEVIDWPGIFDVPCTPFTQAIDETFNDPTYSSVVMEF